MKYHNERKGALLSIFLTLLLLVCSLALPVSATMRAASEEQMHPRLRQTLSIHVENGKVTDSDGIIGNSLRGADAAHPRRAHHSMRSFAGDTKNAIGNAANDVKNAVGDVARGVENAAGNAMRGAEGTTDRTRSENGNQGDNGIAGDDVADAPARNPNDHSLSQQNEGSDSAEDGRSVIGWVVAILIILAIALIVLALLPKKNRERG